MKKNKISRLLALTLSACALGLVSCGEDTSKQTTANSTNSTNQNESSSQSTSNTSSSSSSTTVVDVYALMIDGETSRQLEEGLTDTIEYTITKNGEALTGTALFNAIESNVTGDAVSFNPRTKIVTALKEGSATITLLVKDHDEVSPIVVTYNVTASFWSSSLRRGTVTTNQNSASFTTNGEQPMIAVAKASSNFVFKGTVTVTAYTNSLSFGIGSFYDAGDHALWFGLRNDDSIADTTYSVYIRNFYNGWGSATTDGTPTGYSNIDFGTQTFNFEIIRMGKEYRYSINNIFGSYTNNTDVTDASYPGFYMQEKTMDISNCEYITDETQVQTAFDAYASKEAALFTLNDQAMNMVRGTRHQFTYTSYPENAPITIEWALDKSEMTAGQDNTTISNTGLLILADDAMGSVKVKATHGGVTKEVNITILEKSPDAENDLLSVKGGVMLNEDNSITFPRTSIDIDGVVNENSYDNTAAYTANLKEAAIGNFSIKFKVSDYYTNAQYPKLMVSLGGTYEQFYIVYKTDGTCRIETFTRGVEDDGKVNVGGQWNNSANFENFDASKEHTFEIKVVDGKYEVYLDNGTTPLSFNMDGANRTLVRGVDDVINSTPIRISTKGVSATVSDIVFTNGSTSDIKDFYHYNSNTTITENGFLMNFGNYSWNSRDLYYNRIVATKALPTNFDVNFNLTFSANMSDAKFGITYGDIHVMINNKIKDSSKVSINVNGVGSDWNETSCSTTKLSYAVRIIRNETNLKVYADEQLVKEFTNDNIANGSTMSFWGFNVNDGDKDVTATIDNFSIAEYVQQ